MRVKKLLSLWLTGCLFFQTWGCAGIVTTDEFYEKGKEPINIVYFPPETETWTDEENGFSPSGIEIVSSLPPLPAGQSEYKKLKLTPRNSVAEIQKICREQNLEIIVFPDTLVLATQASSGKWFTGWVEPKTVLLGELIKGENVSSAKEYRIVKLGVCGNAVQGLIVKISPALAKKKILTTVEKRFRSQETFVDRKTVVRVQKKNSSWPWLITTASLIGTGIVIWSGKKER